jgi:triosephosphate isomerase
MCSQIRLKLAELYDQQVAAQVRILYGGSMNTGNVAQFKPCANIDGGLVGGAALDATSFIELVRAFA